MGVRQLTLAVATLIACATAQAQEPQVQSTVPMAMLYISIPLGATAAKEHTLGYGVALQGKRPYETVRVDSRMLNAFEGALAGIEAKWLVAGGVVVASGVYWSRKDSGRSGSQQNPNPPPPPSSCPQPSDPCHK